MKNWLASAPRRYAVMGIGGFLLLALVGPEAATRLVGFTYDEQHTAFPFAPPGFRDVPSGGQSYDGSGFHYDILASGGLMGDEADPATGTEGLSCSRDESGIARCPVLEESSSAYRRISLLLAEAWQAREELGTVSVLQLRADLMGWPAWSQAVMADCSPRICTLRELLESSRFLRIDPEGLLSMDADGDGRVDKDEFAGVPELQSHFLGSDGLGRDSLVRLLRGLRISVLVGFLAALVASFIGIAYGAIAGLAGGMVGGAMMRFVDVLYGLPYIFVVILLISLVGPSTWNLLIAIAAVQWLGMSRTVRGLVGSLLTTPFVDAARTQGCGPVRLVVTHLVPNARRPIITWAALLVPASIKEEAFLSFLGLGVQAPDASLGTLIADGAQRIGEYPWLVAAPSLLLFLLVLLIHVACDEEN